MGATLRQFAAHCTGHDPCQLVNDGELQHWWGDLLIAIAGSCKCLKTGEARVPAADRLTERDVSF
jgi:hypothetical protein